MNFLRLCKAEISPKQHCYCTENTVLGCTLLFILIFKGDLFTYLKGRVIKGENREQKQRDKEETLSSTGSLPRWPQWPVVVQARS